jgi:hypothetical protein
MTFRKAERKRSKLIRSLYEWYTLAEVIASIR